MNEIWKDIPGYEKLYQISNLGRVKSLGNNKTRKEKILSPEIRKRYYSVNLFKNGKQRKYRIHRLVAQAFIPNPDNLPMVNHKDMNKLNNCVENLEWCDAKYNSNYGRPPKVPKIKKKSGRKGKSVINLFTKEVYSSATEAEKVTGIKHIREVCSGRRYSAGGYAWMWYDDYK